MLSNKIIKAVAPAETRVQKCLFFLDSGLRRNDEKIQLPALMRHSGRLDLFSLESSSQCLLNSNKHIMD